MTLNWGIAGSGKISEDFLIALQSNLSDKQHKVIAIANRTLANCERLAKKFNISKYYGNYQDLAKDNEIEIIYVAVLNPYHYEICELMLNHGKHVLCEKPFCMNSLQVEKLLNLAKIKNLFIMEGLWSRFFPAYEHLRKMIQNGNLGEIKEIYIKHGFKGDQNDRIIKKDMGGGILLDIGVYAIQFVELCFPEKPESIKASGKINKEGVDLYFEAKLTYSGGRIANIICSGMEELDNQAVIISTKGTVCIPTYWCPTSLIEPDCHIRSWYLPEPQIPTHFKNSLGLRYEADNVLETIKSGKLSNDKVTAKDMLLIANIEDEIRKQIGVRYNCDKN